MPIRPGVDGAPLPPRAAPAVATHNTLALSGVGTAERSTRPAVRHTAVQCPPEPRRQTCSCLASSPPGAASRCSPAGVEHAVRWLQLAHAGDVGRHPAAPKPAARPLTAPRSKRVAAHVVSEWDLSPFHPTRSPDMPGACLDGTLQRYWIAGVVQLETRTPPTCISWPPSAYIPTRRLLAPALPSDLSTCDLPACREPGGGGESIPG